MIQVTKLTIADLLFAEQAAHAKTKEKLKVARVALDASRKQLKLVSRRLGVARANKRKGVL